MKNQTKKAYNKNFTREESHGAPTVIDIDTLASMSDDELVRLHSHLQTEKEKVSRREDLLVAWETEVCYVQRELMIRSDRRRAHDAYLRSNPDTAFDYYDNSAEEDFDQILN